MKRGIKFYYDHIEEIFLATCIAATVVIVFIQVVMRYVFNNSISWSEELSRYLFVWESWLGVSLGAKYKKHISITMLIEKTSMFSQQIFSIISDVIVILICAVLVLNGTMLVDKMFQMHSYAASFRLPMGYAYAAVPAGCALMIMRSLESIYSAIKNIKAPKFEKEVL